MTAARLADTLTMMSGVLFIGSMFIDRSWIGTMTMSTAVALAVGGYVLRRRRHSPEDSVRVPTRLDEH